MAEQTPIYCDGGCYTAQDMRQINSALVCGEGVSTPDAGDLLVSAPGGSMSVNVAAGHAFIEGDSAGEGMYLVYNDSAVNRVLANGGVQDRIDLIVATVNNDCTWSIAPLQGAEGAPPSAPAVPANSIALAEVYVPAADTTVEAGQITDRRTRFSMCADTGLASDLVLFTASGSFTKATYPGMTGVHVHVLGGGGGGGGCAAPGPSENAEAGGGGGGGYAARIIPAASLAASTMVTVGAAGTGGAAGNNNGGNGGTSSFGAHASATGGGGGNGSAASSGTLRNTGGAAGSGTVGAVLVAGGDGGNGAVVNGLRNVTGSGGTGGGPYGGGSRRIPAGGGNGFSGNNYGGGGSGAGAGASGSANTGGAGAAGVVVVEVLY